MGFHQPADKTFRMKIEAIERAEFRFDRRYFFFCMHSALSQLLHFVKAKYADLLIDVGWSCRRDGVDRLLLDLQPMIAWRRDAVRLASCRTAEDYPRLWRQNVQSVASGQPVILGADYYELAFHPRYHKQHGAHAVLLYGVDEEKETAWIADYNSPFVAYRGEIAVSDLRRARLSANAWNGSINSGGGIQAACLELRPDRVGSLRGSVQDVAETLRGLKSNYFDYFYSREQGMGAVRFLCAGLETAREETLAQHALRLHEQLLPLNEKKQMLARYLEEAKALPLLSHELDPVCKRMEEINELWTTYDKVLLKIAYTPHATGRLRQDALLLAERALRRETEFGERVEASCKALPG